MGNDKGDEGQDERKYRDERVDTLKVERESQLLVLNLIRGLNLP